MVIAFLLFLLFFLGIGFFAAKKSRNTPEDYYLASAQVSPALVGLSAFASANSGYVFIGFIGYTYATGLSAMWLVFGWVFGDLLASFFVHVRMKQAAMRNKALSYACILSDWDGDTNKTLERLIGLISLVFLLTYASAQFMAGSKALYAIFGWPHVWGVILCAVMVSLYSFAGGIRATIWTDVVQSVLMIFSMGLLLVISIWTLGGLDDVLAGLHQIEGFLDPISDKLFIPGVGGAAVFIVSWLFSGLSIIAQPHVMIRFVALEDPQKMMQARIYYYLSYVSFGLLAVGVGLLARLYVGNAQMFDSELAVVLMAQEVLPTALVGLILAGIFSATMSTADSLIISCAAVLTRNFKAKRTENFLLIKGSVVLVAAVALFLALTNQATVFTLVLLSWTALGSAFAPLVIVLCLGWRPSQKVSIAGCLVGLAAALLWRYAGGSATVSEGLIGILAGLWVHGMAAFIRALFGMTFAIHKDRRAKVRDYSNNDPEKKD